MVGISVVTLYMVYYMVYMVSYVLDMARKLHVDFAPSAKSAESDVEIRCVSSTLLLY
jgi:hypothetical protein